ncbi:MAG: hypothetical protein GY861_02275, partial [bacterium]|nr:hypothetical protein [bacterium]
MKTALICIRQLFKKPGSTSPVIRISKDPITIGTVSDQPRTAPITYPIRQFIFNEPLQKQCQETITKAAKRIKTGKELQKR